MKKILPAFVRSLIIPVCILLSSANTYASHILGAQISYAWQSGLTYKVTVVLYGDCSSTSGSFATLPYSVPRVCIYNADTLKTDIDCAIQAPTAGLKVTPVCDADSLLTTCTNITYSIPGVMKFVYIGTVTLPYNSKTWRFIYEGYNGSGSAAGRTAAITNLYDAGGTLMQLIDSLNTETTRGHNSNPDLTVEPVPFYCGYYEDCYNPGGTDILDVSTLYDEPSGDSLYYSLVVPTNSASGGGAACASPFSVTYCSYISGLDAWTTPAVQPMSGATPIECTSGLTFTFDSSTGQLCFEPISPQRSTVVYNIDEYFHDPTLGIVLTGTMQREMNFLVEACSYSSPTGTIDSTDGSGFLSVDSTHFYACQNTDSFVLHFDPTDSDTTLQITITATGLVAGITFNVVNNSTSNPQCTIVGNTNVLAPGNYTVFVIYTDNHCPLQGKKEQAFTITVLPVPTIADSLLFPTTCNSKAGYLIEPGGTGKPWTVKVSIGGIAGDTIAEYTDTASFLDSLAPGVYNLTIFTATSNYCHINTSVEVLPAQFNDTLTFTNPTYCGSPTGTIVMQRLLPFSVDSFMYKYNDQWVPDSGVGAFGFVVTADSTDTVTGLMAGIYDSIEIKRGYCISNPIGPYTLTNPAFTYRTISYTNPTKHCFCDGTDTIFGLHPGQLDTITFQWVPPGGSATNMTPIVRLVGLDSMVYLTGLCEGDYNTFTVRTDSVCSVVPSAFNIVAPPMSPLFNPEYTYGCKSDSVLFVNSSIPSTGLTYHWDFGDGYTDSAKNPTHIYKGIVAMTYTVSLTLFNGFCDTTLTQVISLNNFITAGFGMLPQQYVCQDTMVTFSNSSTGAGDGGSTALTYLWEFGDGTNSTAFNATHEYVNSGQYNVMLIAGNSVPCYDTAYVTITVDSMGPVSINATDSVICRGAGIVFTGIYTSSGETLVNWSFGDENTFDNKQSIIHSYDDTGLFSVTLTAQYRACPVEVATRNIQVYGVPDVYLGADTSMCPGTTPIYLVDTRNMANPYAMWLWNTGATTAGITANKPGIYYVKVTVNGCSAGDTVNIVNDCYINVPNAFTPGIQGVNEYFMPVQQLSKDVVSFTMTVYNRWGQEIFKTTNINSRGWDGAFNAIPQPEGVYIYNIDADFGDGVVEHHTGNFTLIR